MDLSFAVQLAAIRSLLAPGQRREPGVYAVDSAVDDLVASAALRAGRIRTDAAAAPRNPLTFPSRFTGTDTP
jgi:S-adenosylhomocysteine hydrolase